MGLNWQQIEADAISAVKNVLKTDWNAVSTGASAQLKALMSIGQSVETAIATNPPTITASDYQSLLASSNRALDGILQTYEAIGIVIAQQAAQAAIDVVVDALKAAYPAIAFL